MNAKELENLVILANTDYRSRLKLKSVELVNECKPLTEDSNSAVKSPSLKAQVQSYMN